jgi:hypothetical protein
MDKELLKKRCDQLLIGMVGESLVDRWWDSHNKAFDQSPKKQFDENPQSVYNYLLRCAEGEW